MTLKPVAAFIALTVVALLPEHAHATPAPPAFDPPVLAELRRLALEGQGRERFEVIRREAQAPGSEACVDPKSAMPLFARLRAQGYVYLVTGDLTYARAVQSKLLECVGDLETNDRTPVALTRLEDLIEAYGCVRTTIESDARRQIDRWFLGIANELNKWLAATRADPKLEHRQSINWNAHRIKIIGLIGWALHEDKLVEQAAAEGRTYINDNILADGSSLDFIDRDALQYHVFGLRQMVVLSVFMQSRGVNLASYSGSDGAGIVNGLAFIEPYCTGAKIHIEFRNTKVAGDRKRQYASYEKPWDPRNGAYVMALGSLIKPEFGSFCVNDPTAYWDYFVGKAIFDE